MEWTTEDIKATEGTSRTVCVATIVSEESDEDITASKKGRWIQEEETIFVNSTKIIFEKPDNTGLRRQTRTFEEEDEEVTRKSANHIDSGEDVQAQIEQERRQA